MRSWLPRQAMDVLHPLVILNWEEKTSCIPSRLVGVLLALGTIVHYDRPVERWPVICGPRTCPNAATSIKASPSRRSCADQ
jgi:hypothetical protein